MKDKIDGDNFIFPPIGVRLTRSQLQKLTMDLPHLCLNNQITYDQNKKGSKVDYTISKGNDVNEYNQSSLNVLLNKVHIQKTGKNNLETDETIMPEKTKRVQYSKRRYDYLIKTNSLMCDETVSLLICWIDIMKERSKHHRLHFVSSTATKVLIDQYKRYELCQDKGIGPEIIDERKTTIDKFSRIMSCDEDKKNKSDCIFMIVHVNKNHWCLLCLLNLRTIQTNFIDFETLKKNQMSTVDSDGKSFSEYKPPCIFIFDSLFSKESEDVKNLVEGLRFWLTNDEKINPNMYQFTGSLNLPATMIYSEQQKDGCSCGYFVIRNIIGMVISFDDIFPIEIKDLVDKTNPKKYKESIKDIFKRESMKKIRKINQQKSMMFTHDSVATILRQEVKSLIDRLIDLNNYCKVIRKNSRKPNQNNVDEKTAIISLVESIQSFSLNKKITRDSDQQNSEKQYVANTLYEFQNFF